ncbi:MAG TPA: MoaD/ThiS family protein [Burkholderiaceae bacterium]|jgi:molybdopterin converting factor small subunit
MAKLAFTQQLRRFIAVPEVDSTADNLRAALEEVFADNPQLRGYILDEQGHLRQHVTIFIDGLRIRDRVTLNEPLSAASQVHVLQALSGG